MMFIFSYNNMRKGFLLTVPWPPPSDPKNKKLYKQYLAAA